MDVAVFGAGIAGLMSAITLGARGWHCRVFERSRSSHDAGMGFILMEAGIRCMESFGVQLNGDFSGVPLVTYRGRDEKGRMVYEQALPEGTRSFRRRDLIAALMATLPSRDEVVFDAGLAGLEFDKIGNVRSALLSCNGGSEHVRADLYVAADGSQSRARNALFPNWPVPQARVSEIVGLVKCADSISWSGNVFNKFHAADGGLALGIVPVDSSHLVWFLQFDSQRFPAPPDDAGELRTFVERQVGDWAEPIPHLLSITDFSRVHAWRPVDADLVPRFHQGNLVLAGDAAHPLLPFTSQGVSSAIADAVALANIISNKNDLADKLPSYSLERREWCARYVAKGRQLAQQFLVPQGPGSFFLPLAC